MIGAATTFRLLDGRVGWDPRPGDGLVGTSIETGELRLTPPAGPAPAARATLGRSRDGTWWLAGHSGLRRMGPCEAEFRIWGESRSIIDLAVRALRVAVVLEKGRVEVFDGATGRQVADVRLPGSARVELSRRGSLTVTDGNGNQTYLDASGLICDEDQPCRPGDPIPPRPTPRPWPADVRMGKNGFDLPGRGAFDWKGHRITSAEVVDPLGVQERLGQYLSAPLDSGIPGCRWHRVRLDAEVPVGSALEVAIATTDGPAGGRTPQPVLDGIWRDFPAGDPYQTDWFELLPGTLDSTIRTSPGRYAYVRIRLIARGEASPVVHQIRLDLPRSTSIDHLPAAYSEDPVARDFTERFVGIVDAEIEEIDDVLARRPALLDADALPDDALGWLAGLLGTGFDAEMPVANRRAVLRAAPSLFRRRGTPQGLVDTLQVALGVSCTVEEMGTARPWGALGGTHVGSVRLFSRSAARVRLGASQLGAARVDGRGDPDRDALLAGAHRIRVHVPAGTDTELVARVVRSQIPAHVASQVVAATPGFVATTLHLGIDTTLTSPASAVVGDVALGRRGVVPAGRAADVPFVVGRPAITRTRAVDREETECTC